MGQTKLTMEKKTKALTLLEQGVSVIRVAVDLKVTRMAIFTLIKAVATVPYPSRKTLESQGRHYQGLTSS